MNETNYLEKGDFFPFIKIGGREIYNLVDDRYTLIFNTNQQVITNQLSKKYNILVRRKDENVFNIIPDPDEKLYVLLLSPNRRIKEIFENANLDELIDIDLSKYKENYNFPFIMIENA